MRIRSVALASLCAFVITFSWAARAQLLPLPLQTPTIGTAPTARPLKMLGTVHIEGTLGGGNRCVVNSPCKLIGQFGERNYGRPEARVLRVRGPAPSTTEVDLPTPGWGPELVTASMPSVPGRYTVRASAVNRDLYSLFTNSVVIEVGTARGNGADVDGDGHRAIQAGGDDCDDFDAMRHPGLPESCDAGYLDEDCDTATVSTRDQDADGEMDAVCCNALVRDGDVQFRCGIDCDDHNPAIRQGAQACGPNGSIHLCQARLAGSGTGAYQARPRPVQFTAPWAPYQCPAGSACFTQPNATGVCR